MDIKLNQPVWVAVADGDVLLSSSQRIIASEDRDSVRAAIVRCIRRGFGRSSARIPHDRIAIKRVVVKELV